MLEALIELLSPFLWALGIYLIVAMTIRYITRWIRISDSDRGAYSWGWPFALMYGAWLLISRSIRLLVNKMDRLIYLLTRRKIDESEYGILWEGRMPYGRHLEVEVRDSTGKYAIPVPPNDYALLVKEATPVLSNGVFGGWHNDAVMTSIKTAKQAVEWTYNLKDGELNPIVRA